MSAQPDLIIVSGLSGSGKSVALQSLEDIGYYCIDNLPSVLLPEFARHLQNGAQGARDDARGAAVGIDSRNRHFLSLLDENLDKIARHENFCRLLFLQAEEQALVRRYSETRRRHPLTGARTPLLEGIRRERRLLQPLHDRAEKVVDTTDTTAHELRALVRDFAAGADAGPLFLIESFGFKYGAPRQADFVFDVRCLPNPYWEENLRALSGLDSAVAEYLGADENVRCMVGQLHGFLEQWLPGFAAENRSYFTVAIGCTGGRHRSVYVAERLRELFSAAGIAVQARHRDLEK